MIYLTFEIKKFSLKICLLQEKAEKDAVEIWACIETSSTEMTSEMKSMCSNHDIATACAKIAADIKAKDLSEYRNVTDKSAATRKVITCLEGALDDIDKVVNCTSDFYSDCIEEMDSKEKEKCTKVIINQRDTFLLNTAMYLGKVGDDTSVVTTNTTTIAVIVVLSVIALSIVVVVFWRRRKAERVRESSPEIDENPRDGRYIAELNDILKELDVVIELLVEEIPLHPHPSISPITFKLN